MKTNIAGDPRAALERLARDLTVSPADLAAVLKAGPMMCVIACLNAGVYAMVAWSAYSPTLVLGWLLASCGLFIKIQLNSERARKRGMRDRPLSARAYRRMVAFAMLLAGPWAFVALAFFGHGDSRLDAVTPIVCAGMAMAGALTCHRVTPIALTYFFTILGAICLASILRGIETFWPNLVFSAALGPAVTYIVLTTARAVRERDAMLVEVSAKNEALNHAQAKITRLAYEDGVTGLPNRQALGERLETELASARRRGAKIAFLLLDLDRFKNVNDSLGHNVGDQLLNHIGARLSDTIRAGDIAARLGGDEFAVIMTDAVSAARAERFAQRVRAQLIAPLRLSGAELHPDSSIGVAVFPDDAETATDLMVCADIALHRAKEQGKGRVAVYDSAMATAVCRADDIERDLRLALACGQLELHYQPKVDVETGLIRGAEALLRWPDADRGPTPPSVFLPVAEERGLILDISQFVFAQVASDLALFRSLGAPPPIALNIHPVDLKAPRTLLSRLERLRAEGVGPEEVIFEITEGCVVGRGADAASMVLDQLDERGVMLSLDDFGTGHASLSHLKRLPVGEIKIDRSFVSGLCETVSDRAIVSATIELARCMGMRSVAEGVETEAQLAKLRALGCTLAQGYLFSPAVDRDAFAALLARQAARQDPWDARAAACSAGVGPRSQIS